MSEEMTDMINWKNFDNESSNFKDRNPTKWAFIEEFLDRDFYEKLYDTYPKYDDTWDSSRDWRIWKIILQKILEER